MSTTSPDPTGELSPAEMQSAWFAQLVMQLANLAFLALGRAPHPETGKPMRDLDAARMFIGQLEMLEAKTKGNLSPAEQSLLQQSLMSLRMAFVETVNAPLDSAAPAESKTASTESADAAKTDEGGKRFSKTYPPAPEQA